MCVFVCLLTFHVHHDERLGARRQVALLRLGARRRLSRFVDELNKVVCEQLELFRELLANNLSLCSSFGRVVQIAGNKVGLKRDSRKLVWIVFDEKLVAFDEVSSLRLALVGRMLFSRAYLTV